MKYFFVGLFANLAIIIISFFVIGGGTGFLLTIVTVIVISLIFMLANSSKRPIRKWLFVGVLVSIPITFFLLVFMIMLFGDIC